MAEANVEDHADGFVLKMTHAGKKRGTSRIYFDRTTWLPFRREVYSSSGRLIKTIHIDETKSWQGAEIPWKLRFEDHLRKGVVITIVVIEATELIGDFDTLFSKQGLKPRDETNSQSEEK